MSIVVLLLGLFHAGCATQFGAPGDLDTLVQQSRAAYGPNHEDWPENVQAQYQRLLEAYQSE